MHPALDAWAPLTPSAVGVELTGWTAPWWCAVEGGRVRASVTAIGLRSAGGLPYLRPEIQLFYKAKGRRPKDETDFAAVLPALDDAARAWLDHALGLTLPEHPWRTALRGGAPA